MRREWRDSVAVRLDSDKPLASQVGTVVDQALAAFEQAVNVPMNPSGLDVSISFETFRVTDLSQRVVASSLAMEVEMNYEVDDD